jgi:hypothetical protein
LQKHHKAGIYETTFKSITGIKKAPRKRVPENSEIKEIIQQVLF